MTTLSTTLTGLSGNRKDPDFTQRTASDFQLTLSLVFLLVLLLWFPTQTRADDSHQAIKSKLSHQSIKLIRRYPTFELTRTVELPTDTSTIKFLLEHLDLTCAIIRAWDLEHFFAREIEPGFYHARDSAGLKGYVRRLNESDTRFVFGGVGTFESSKLPITLRGKALSTITTKPSARGTRITGTLHIRVSNTFIHYMSQIFYPVVRSVADNKADHLVNVGKKTIRKINQYPDKTSRRLSSTDSVLEKNWIQFLRGRSSTE